MGATTFFTRAIGPTPREAFRAAVDNALYEHGRGYTGTIAEKDSFVMIDVPEGADPVAFAQALIDEGDERVDDKWGPAGCVMLAEGKYLFFGWASE